MSDSSLLISESDDAKLSSRLVNDVADANFPAIAISTMRLSMLGRAGNNEQRDDNGSYCERRDWNGGSFF